MTIEHPKLVTETLGVQQRGYLPMPVFKHDFELYDTDENAGAENYSYEVNDDLTIYADSDSDGVYIRALQDGYNIDVGQFDNFEDAIYGIQDASDEGMFDLGKETQYQQWTTKNIGATNYREIIETYVTKNKNQIIEMRLRIEDINKETAQLQKDRADMDPNSKEYKENTILSEKLYQEKIDLKVKRRDLQWKQEEEGFTSDHWKNIENPLYHIRVQDVMINGEKVLLIEEIQSDWHQAGRKKGIEKRQSLKRKQP